MLSITSLLKNKASQKTGLLLLKLSLILVAFSTSSFKTPNTNTQVNNNQCENGLSAALGYNAFVLNNVSVSSGDTEGPIAMGGDLTLDGTFTVAAHTGGSFFHNGESQAASLVVNGKIIYKSNQGINLNQGFVKIGNLTGSNVYDKDNNNVTTNTRITPGTYDQSPRIHLQRNQEFNSVNVGNIIDFNAAFAKLNTASFTYSQLTNNIVIENGNKITLANNTTNVLHLTGNELNNLTNFTFNNQPTADSPLIINVNYAGDFTWNVQNQAGIGDQQGAFIIYNFYNSSKVIINSGGTIMGTVLAPNSDVEKRTSGNINGQVIAKSYIHLSGELHQHTYNHCEEKVCTLAVDAGDKQVVCEGSQVTLTASASNSDCIDNITYSWSGPGIVGNNNEQSITVDASGTYTVKVQDCDNCLAEDTVVVKINKNPEVTVTSINTNCYAEEGAITFNFEDYQYRSHIKLSIDGGNSYVKVKDNIGTYTFSELQANTYDIAIVWGNNQCPLNLDSIIIEELQTMTVETGDDQEICAGESITLSAHADTLSVNECSTAISYLWSTGETTQSINVSPTENTTYTVTTSNCGNCTAQDSVSVFVNEAPIAHVTSENGTCANTTNGSITFYFDAESEAANIDLSIDGGTTYTTTSTASGSYTFENLNAGTYSTSVRSNENGCAVILDEIVVEEILSITINAGNDQEICSGESVTLTANTIEEDGIVCKPCTKFLWSTGETTQSITVSPTENTEYSVSLTNCDYCVTEDTVSVFVNETPIAVVSSENGTCANSTNGSISFYFDAETTDANIDLSIDGGNTYTTVSTADGVYTFENLTAGTYSTSIRSTNKGCAAILEDVIIEETLSITLDAGNDQEICSGESVTLTANTIEEDGINCKPCTKFLWSNGETTKSITVSPTEDTEYSVSLTNCDYCVVEDTVSVFVENISVDAGDNITIEYGQTGTLSVTPYLPGVDYLWSTGETSETISVSPTETTTYTVIAKSEKGCYAEDNVTVEVTVDPCLSQEYDVVAYPVPVDARGVLNIDIAIDKEQTVNYTTYRLNGTRIGASVNVNLPKGCNTINVDLVKHCSFVANTQYILIVTGEGWVETIDFITLP